MPLRIVIDGAQAGARLKRTMARYSKASLLSMRQTAHELADDIEAKGRADIAAAGNFGGNWTSGFNAKVTEGGGNILVNVTMGGEPPVNHWRVFQYGAVIQGAPLLWIPLSFASDAKGVRARDYPGPLFRVDRAGKAPLLMSGKPAQPKYFGKESVTIPKKFHLVEIAREASRRASKIFSAYFRSNRSG